jgi:hypothetical protein
MKGKGFRMKGKRFRMKGKGFREGALLIIT